jgi:ferredoxin-NADP reductase
MEIRGVSSGTPVTDIITRPARPKHLEWQVATVVATTAESSTARTIVFDIGRWDGHRPGQHIDVRLTADDGYQATRSYSLSSGPNEGPQITVQRFGDGEVSPFLVDEVLVGDTIELRGPIGGYFVWDRAPTPLLLIGGGSGLAPLRSMWRSGTTNDAPLIVAASAHDQRRLLFADELSAHDATIHLTRQVDATEASPLSGVVAGRIDRDAIDGLLSRAGPGATVFVCGPTAFVESIANHLRDAGVEPSAMRLERFG